MSKLLLFIAFFAAAFSVRAQSATTLSPRQIDALAAIKTKTEQQSAPYATKMAATLQRIYANMLAPKEDQKLRKRLARELHFYAGKLLDMKGQSYRDALAVLTSDQRAIVRDALQKPDASKDIGEVIAKTFGLGPK